MAPPTHHQARKRFGQHFLTNPAIIDAIVDAIDPRPGQPMVEIGPGLGALTLPLVARLGHLTVIELDRDLARRLRGNTNLDVIESDALTVDFSNVVATTPASKLRVVGNLPYNISTPILFHLLRFMDAVDDQHVMVQTEVADRMAAPPCTTAYGRLSVMLQCHYAISSLFRVSPEHFSPPPRVNSSVVRMTPSQRPDGLDTQVLGELVRVSFSQRRKLLRHTLGSWLGKQNYQGVFDTQRRAEEVSVKEYVDLAISVAGNRPAQQRSVTSTTSNSSN